MKEKITLNFILFLFCISTFAQKPGTVLYNNSWSIMGRTETLLIPNGFSYLLQHIYHGNFTGTTIDTLQLNEGILKGKKFEVSFTDKRIILQFLGKGGWKKKLNFKEYSACSPFVNQKQNLWYAWNLHYELEKATKRWLGYSNSKWKNRPRHDVEVISKKNVKSSKVIFSRMCHDEFKHIADSVHKSNLALLNDIASGETD